MLSRILMHVTHIIAGAATVAVGSVVGFLGLAILLETLTNSPWQHLLWGSISLAMCVVGPLLIYFGAKLFWHAFVGVSDVALQDKSTGPSSASSPQVIKN